MSYGKIKRAIIISKDTDKTLETTEIDRARLINLLYRVRPKIRGNGNLKGKSFYLSKSYNWIIVQDDTGAMCLVPLKKET